MANREEVKGTLKHYLMEAMLGNFDEDSIDNLLNSEVKALDLQGVVIKVDRELPDCRTYEFINIDGCKRECDKIIMGYDCPVCRAGYVAVEPLIEGNSTFV